jgi:hypothetical protein
MRASDLVKNRWALIVADPDKHQWSDNLIQLVKNAYQNTSLGSFINNAHEVAASDWVALDWDPQPDLDCTVFYRRPRANETWQGYKIQGIGHDGKPESKQKVISRVKALLGKPGTWIESSDAMARTLGKLGMQPVRDEKVLQQLFPNTELRMLDNNGNYERQAGRDRIKEQVFGNPIVKSLNEDANSAPTVLYHVTPTKNLSSIAKRGLVPSIGSRSSQLETESNLYFFPTKDAAEDALMNWLGDEFPEDEPLALLAVSSKGLEGKFTPGAEYEYTVSTVVPPQNLKVLSKNI